MPSPDGQTDPLNTGHPWVIFIDTLVVDGNTASIEGTVGHSENLTDVGLRFSFTVVDDGSTGDLLNGSPLVGGNFTVT